MSRGGASCALLLLAGWACPAAEPASAWQWDHRPGECLSLSQGGRLVWTFRYAAAENHPCFHPLATDQGAVLSDLAPKDHPWHRGLWFAWKFINGVNYWEKPYAGISTCSGPPDIATADDGARIHLTVDYAHQGTVVLREQRTLVAGVPDAQGAYTIDWDMTFTPVGGDVLLDRTPLPGEAGGKPWGGYAGMSFRATLGGTPAFITADGTGAKGRNARWMDLDLAAGGVAIFDHPGNPRHPVPWYVGDARLPYLGAALLFNQPLRLAAGTTLRLRYRVLVHRGPADPAALDHACDAWLATPRP